MMPEDDFLRRRLLTSLRLVLEILVKDDFRHPTAVGRDHGDGFVWPD